jgi:hypothetical protein
MWRGRLTACSRNTVGSPKAEAASRIAIAVGAGLDPSQSPAATSGGRLHEQRESDRFGVGEQGRDLVVTGRRAQHRQAGAAGGGEGADLVAGKAQHVGGWPDERDSDIRARLSEERILRQEPVAGVDRIRFGVEGRLDDSRYVEVGRDGVAALADLVRLVRLLTVERVAVLIGIDRHGPDTELVRGAHRANSDLAAIRD